LAVFWKFTAYRLGKIGLDRSCGHFRPASCIGRDAAGRNGGKLAMESESLLRDCIEQFGKRNGIAGLALEPNGCAGIEVRDGRRVYIKLDRELDRAFIYRALLPMHFVNSDLLRRCMELNLLEAGAGGGVLSMSPQMEAIVYHTSAPARIVDATWLEGAIEDVLARGERLVQLLVRMA
jgi:hypothetical protein